MPLIPLTAQFRNTILNSKISGRKKKPNITVYIGATVCLRMEMCQYRQPIAQKYIKLDALTLRTQFETTSLTFH